jgi:AraC-like DNA-binding protein
LRTTLKPVKEVAVSCGYGDPLYFTRVFHKAHGVSPTRFREAEYGKKR